MRVVCKDLSKCVYRLKPMLSFRPLSRMAFDMHLNTLLKEQGSYNLVQNRRQRGAVLRPRCIGPGKDPYPNCYSIGPPLPFIFTPSLVTCQVIACANVLATKHLGQMGRTSDLCMGGVKNLCQQIRSSDWCFFMLFLSPFHENVWIVPQIRTWLSKFYLFTNWSTNELS